MASQIFLIINIEIVVILTYISSYFITSELYLRPLNTNTRNNDPIQNIQNNRNNNNNNNNKDNYFNNNFQNITEKLEKITYFVSTILGVLLTPKVLYATHG